MEADVSTMIPMTRSSALSAIDGLSPRVATQDAITAQQDPTGPFKMKNLPNQRLTGHNVRRKASI